MTKWEFFETQCITVSYLLTYYWAVAVVLRYSQVLRVSGQQYSLKQAAGNVLAFAYLFAT